MRNELTLFPFWVSKFGKDPEIITLSDQVLELRYRRSKGNHKLPDIQLGSDFWQTFDLYIGMRRAEEGRNNLPVGRAYEAHLICMNIFTPIAHRTFWSRWLYLERALELASLNGDLLFSAIVLRTMAEDVWALLELSRFEEALSRTSQDLDKIRKHGDLLFSRFLPPLKDFPDLPGSSLPHPFEGHGYEVLRSAFQSLNDYVHPNYGSHLLALFPENSRALSVLLRALIAIYGKFFEVPWVEEPLEEPLTELPPVQVRPWEEETAYLQETILPEIQQHRLQRGLASSHDDPAPNLKAWIKRSLETQEEVEIAWNVTPDWFEPLRSLAEFVLGWTDHDQRLYEALIEATQGLGVALPFLDLLIFAGARRLALELEQLFPAGRPSPDREPLDWFKFCIKAIELMLTTTQHKMNIMLWALVRELNDRNPVGSMLAMRSIIEHYAVAIWLGRRLDKAWKEASRHGSAGKLPINDFLRIEEAIAQFLAGTKGTSEAMTAWKEEWKQLGLDKAFNLRSASEKGLAGDVLGFLYNFGSSVIHGRRARGIELCPPTDKQYRIANLSRALLTADLLCDMKSYLDITVPGSVVIGRMESLHRALSKEHADWKKVIRTVLVPKEKLRKGVDYFGKGTLDDPFTFANGLYYYDMFTRLCRQVGLDNEKRQLIQAPDGRFLDEVPDAMGINWYFLTPMSKGE